jgi:hypothetical protein
MIASRKEAHMPKEDVVIYTMRLPRSLHGALKELAETDRRSLHAEMIYLLEQALEERQEGKAAA